MVLEISFDFLVFGGGLYVCYFIFCDYKKLVFIVCIEKYNDWFVYLMIQIEVDGIDCLEGNWM